MTIMYFFKHSDMDSKENCYLGLDWYYDKLWERSGSVVECLTRGIEAAGSSLTSVTALWPWARHINPSLVLVQPRKTSSYITERLLIGGRESNLTNKYYDKKL